ncbi:MSHA biogenesis protein MshI [Oceanisphaera avium]|uniref:MSHA biogenesis protein MshI n=1 Tax=Oceanisphaera avium TaxID=1903694 RepID=A0A1Y0CWG4_9GAMM|nr:MSHA biogenesis protein MshI [Oceanisphaera avium]ART79237.1 MSHA biogenesis protein MshI [Oceanisphaera avium]
MAFLPTWLKPKRSGTAISIYLTSNRLVAIDAQELTRALEQEIDERESAAQALRAFIDAQQWQGRAIHLVLNRHWYQQTLIEKPAMPEAELSQALPWCMRELVSQPIENLLFDYIDLPPGPVGQSRIAVYSSERDQLAHLVQAINFKGEVASIGVDELVIANLLSPEERGLLLHKMPGQELTVTFIHHQQWHFSRTIRGFQALDDEQMPVDQFVFDNLLLELQRSIDYAVGQLKLNPPENWYLALPQRVTPVIQEAIRQVFDIAPLSLTTATLSPLSLPALGMLKEGPRPT